MFPFLLKDAAFKDQGAPIYYVLARNGLFLIKRNAVFTSCTRVQGLPWLGEHGAGYQVHCPRMPAWVLTQALGFFRAVYRRFGGEAILLLNYAPGSTEFQLVAPAQEVSPLSCFYEPQPVPEGWVKAGTIHSHGQLPGVHSEVDEEDERFDDGLHLTLGRILGDPSIDCELVVGESRFELHPAEVIEPIPAEAKTDQEFGFPQAWLGMVTGTPSRPTGR